MFFVLIGSHEFNKDIDQNNKPQHCPHCNNYSVQPRKHRRFVTLFWVPIIPVSWRKELHCSICNWRTDL